ncbi:S24 family peptidase [Janthinobacterium sp. PSPC3-1]|uniref:S24 family peptidase n=1 Tax=Janthinobacterium sp. PSPC3-1 TaxID=2804653 RepID=UPI003CF37DF0
MRSQKKIVPLAKTIVGAVAIDLVPGLRNRINVELAKLNVARGSQHSFLSEITGRAEQTVRRWLDRESPGLPDLRSLAILCIQFGVDANWLLGLTRHRTSFLFHDLTDAIASHLDHDDLQKPDWISAVIDETRLTSHELNVHMLWGDDMAPLINPGAAVFFDRDDCQGDSSGVYVIEYHGQTVVRNIEVRPEKGVVLHCENIRYAPIVIEQRLDGQPLELKIIGKVKIALNPVHF